MFKKIGPKKLDLNAVLGSFPHCDQRILHSPGDCKYCDENEDWQALRIAWGIAFTGWEPEGSELPCPADHARGKNHQLWPGNQATEVQ